MIQLELQFIDKPKRECPECGGDVVGRSDRIYCSKACYDKVYRKTNLERIREKKSERWKAKKARRTKRACQVCGKAVTGKLGKVYCSARCYQLHYQAANKERIKEQRRQYREAHRVKIRKYWHDNREKLRASARDSWHRHRDKNLKAMKAYRAANLTKCKAAQQRWRKNNPDCHRMHESRRRARKKANGVEPTDEYRKAMVNPLTHQVCFYCGTGCTGNHHWDHHIPIAAGGPDAPWNLVIACPTCNMSKGARLPESVFCEEIFKE